MSTLTAVLLILAFAPALLVGVVLAGVIDIRNPASFKGIIAGLVGFVVGEATISVVFWLLWLLLRQTFGALTAFF